MHWDTVLPLNNSSLFFNKNHCILLREMYRKVVPSFLTKCGLIPIKEPEYRQKFVDAINARAIALAVVTLAVYGILRFTKYQCDKPGDCQTRYISEDPRFLSL